MNKRIGSIAAAALLVGATSMAHSTVTACAETIKYRHTLTIDERRCLSQILRTGNWRDSPDFHQEMMAAARVSRADLNWDRRKEYFFVIRDFASCGTAGCSTLIAEADSEGTCHEIYSGAGHESAVTVLRRRDHGYRRLYTPCEVRFDGRRYEQVRWQCPTLLIRR